MGIAWYEEVQEAEQGGSVLVTRKGACKVGERRERRGRTYQDSYRSGARAQSGWRTAGFGMGGGHEAYDAELAALVYGLIHLLGTGGSGRPTQSSRIPRAAMTRAASDVPGPGQETAIRIIELAQRTVDRQTQSPSGGPRLIEESRETSGRCGGDG